MSLLAEARSSGEDRGEERAEKCYELLATEESIHTLIHKCMYTFIHIQTY